MENPIEILSFERDYFAYQVVEYYLPIKSGCERRWSLKYFPLYGKIKAKINNWPLWPGNCHLIAIFCSLVLKNWFDKYYFN